MKVLIVDDAAFMRLLLSNLLKECGHEVVAEAVNGGDAFEKYEMFQPDLVTMDITMPEVDGIQGLKMIKQKYPNANVIMCSAMGQQPMVIEAIQSGASDFIVKPFDKDRVLEAINKIQKGK